LAKVASYPCLYSVDVGEPLGLHSALQWLSDMQFDNVNFETDSKLTYDAFYATRDDTSEFECIITSCHFLFNSFFTNSRVKFVKRQANGIAHAFTGESTLLASLVVCFNIREMTLCVQPGVVTPKRLTIFFYIAKPSVTFGPMCGNG